MLKIGKYEIDTVLFEKGFGNNCTPYDCDSTCCASGVFLDPADMERVLLHKNEIKNFMDETQTKDESLWFDVKKEIDNDFPSGFANSTNVVNNKCAFLNREGKCSIQIYGKESGLGSWAIKPFFCIAFPITVDGGALTFDDYRQDKTKCCTIVQEKNQSLVKSCKDELVFILGENDYSKLLEMEAQYTKNKL